MREHDEAFLAQFARRNWFVLGFLALLSLVFRAPHFTYGVIAGGIIVIGGYHWLQWSLKGFLDNPSRKTSCRVKLSFFVRLGTLGAVLYFLVAIVKVNSVGLILGLSVIVINLFWTTFKRVF